MVVAAHRPAGRHHGGGVELLDDRRPVVAPAGRQIVAPPDARLDHVAGADDEWVRTHPCYRHLGLYAYKARLLEQLSRMTPGRLEMIEKLEQLRVLENGHSIVCGVTNDPTIGVDTPEDADKYAALLD